MSDRDTYWCDHCKHTKVEGESYSTHHKHDYKKHIESKKHKTNSTNDYLKDDEEGYCLRCETIFSKEAYKRHKDRNKYLWYYQIKHKKFLDCVCNNFVYNNKRYNNFFDMKEALPPTKEEKKKEKEDMYRKNGAIIISVETCGSDNEDWVLPEQAPIVNTDEICEDCGKDIYIYGDNDLDKKGIDSSLVERLHDDRIYNICKCKLKRIELSWD